MNSIISKFYSLFLGLVIIGLLGVQEVQCQTKVSKKKRKIQNKEALGDRLFIEGQKFLMLEDYEKAYFYFEKSLEYQPEEPAIYFKLSEILTRANQVDKALEYGLQAVERDPENKYYHLLIAEIYSKQKKPQAAAEVLNSLMVNSADNQQYILELASLYLSAQDYDKALEALNRAEEYYGVVEQLTFQKQRIYLRNNDLGNAIKEGEKLIDANPGNSQYVLSLVEILFNNNKLDRGLEILLDALDNYPNQPDLQLAVYTIYKQKGEPDTANDYLIKAFNNPDLSGEIKSQTYADILQEMKTETRDQLLDELKSLLVKHHPDDPFVMTVLGDHELSKKNAEQALEYYQKSIAINPANENLFQRMLPLMFELQKEFEEIEQYSTMATEEFPDQAEFWFFDGTAKSAQKKNKDAKEALEKALELNAGKNKQLDLLVHGQLGDTYHALGQKDDAYSAYEKALTINPNNDHVLNNYAYYLSLDKKNLDKAKKMSTKLVEKFPTNSTYLDTHAWVLFQLEEYRESETYMLKALENQKEPSGIMFEHYGDILYKLGEVKEALKYWEKAEGKEESTELLKKKIRNKQYYE